MSNEQLSESIRCFIIIMIATAGIAVIDLIARAFFYEQAQRITPYLPLLIGSITLCVMGIAKRNRNKTDASRSQTNTAGIRRVRVTGPIK